MDEALIKNWNDKVPKDGQVFHLGDFSFGDAKQYRKRLNGTINFIRGNHDRPAEMLHKFSEAAFRSFEDVRMVVIEDQRIWLSHYAHRVWPHSHRGCWMLCGHSHGTLLEALPDAQDGKLLDVGVDVHNYQPLSYAEVKQIMDKKSISKVDHH
jgi:calcineurin-like phosphoesterase family protein